MEYKIAQTMTDIHDPNDPNSTLKLLSHRTMLYPPIYCFRCKICKEKFKYIKKDGKFVLSD